MNIEHRRWGAWLGLAVGDALGAGVEFMSAERIAATHGRVTEMLGGGPFGWAPGETTDDTALATATAAAYAGDDFVLENAARAMVAWLGTGPKDVGNLTRRALRAIASGTPPRDAGRLCVADGGANAGNGSLMRCLSTGLVRRPDDVRLVDETVELSSVTHADTRCVAACVAFNVILATLVRTPDRLAEAFQNASEIVSGINDEVSQLVAGVAAGGRGSFQNAPIGYVLLALERALISARDAQDFEPALVDVVGAGGDTDTNGAIAGALLGARFGLSRIPPRWTHAVMGGPWARPLLPFVANAEGRQ